MIVFDSPESELRHFQQRITDVDRRLQREQWRHGLRCSFCGATPMLLGLAVVAMVIWDRGSWLALVFSIPAVIIGGVNLVWSRRGWRIRRVQLQQELEARADEFEQAYARLKTY